MPNHAVPDHPRLPGPRLVGWSPRDYGAPPHEPPRVVHGALVRTTATTVRYTRPNERGMRIWGSVVVDDREIARIRARARYAALPWWRRLLAPTPEGW